MSRQRRSNGQTGGEDSNMHEKGLLNLILLFFLVNTVVQSDAL